MKKILNNARILDASSNLDINGWLLIENGKITDFGEGTATKLENTEIIDCEGKCMSAGLIDIHVHLREPGFEHKETIASGTMAAAAGGVTSIACMPNTNPTIDDISIVEFIKRKAKDEGVVNVYVFAAMTKGLSGSTLTEMGLLKEAGVVGFTNDGLPVMKAGIMRKIMEYASMLDTVVGQHAEDLTLTGDGVMNESPMATKLGLKGIPNASEIIIVERDIRILELTGGHYHVQHISTKEAIEAVRQAKKRGLHITCEATPHHFTLTDEAVGEYRTFAKMSPPLRSEEDRQAVIEGLADGTIDAIATDHAPHEQDCKRVPFASAANGIVGLETMLPLALELYHSGKMSLLDVLGVMTYKPADLIKIPAGRIERGAMADLVLFDVDKEWTIDITKFKGKSYNSPFDKREVKGKVLKTFVGGEVVYEDE